MTFFLELFQLIINRLDDKNKRCDDKKKRTPIEMNTYIVKLLNRFVIIKMYKIKAHKHFNGLIEA